MDFSTCNSRLGVESIMANINLTDTFALWLPRGFLDCGLLLTFSLMRNASKQSELSFSLLSCKRVNFHKTRKNNLITYFSIMCLLIFHLWECLTLYPKNYPSADFPRCWNLYSKWHSERIQPCSGRYPHLPQNPIHASQANWPTCWVQPDARSNNSIYKLITKCSSYATANINEVLTR